MTPPDASAIARLRDRLRGSVAGRLDGAFGSLVVPPFPNPQVRWEPDVVVAPAGVRDVIEAVRFARRHGLAVAIRSGGVGWLGAPPDSVLLDLAALDGIRVDPVRRRVRVEGGAIWRDVAHELAAFGLAAAGPQFPRLGVAGHVLGGGHGWLSNRLGWASDTLVSVDVVTADGDLVHVDAEHEPDLFWAMRGAGHNFGVVVALELEVVPLDEVTFGLVWFHPDATTEALVAGRDLVLGAGDELTSIVSAAQPPPSWSGPDELRGRGAVHLLVCHSGTAGQAEADLAALRRPSRGRRRRDRSDPMAGAVHRERRVPLRRPPQDTDALPPRPGRRGDRPHRPARQRALAVELHVDPSLRRRDSPASPRTPPR